MVLELVLAPGSDSFHCLKVQLALAHRGALLRLLITRAACGAETASRRALWAWRHRQAAAVGYQQGAAMGYQQGAESVSLEWSQVSERVGRSVQGWAERAAGSRIARRAQVALLRQVLRSLSQQHVTRLFRGCWARWAGQAGRRQAKQALLGRAVMEWNANMKKMPRLPHLMAHVALPPQLAHLARLGQLYPADSLAWAAVTWSRTWRVEVIDAQLKCTV